jgi:HSP20 family protein
MSQLLPERSRTGSEGVSPLSELGQLNERMRRMLEQTFGGMLDEPAGWVPAVDIEELEDAYVVEAEVPGVKREDVNIEVTGNELTISGEIKVREREGIIRRRTRRVGEFEFRVVLPNEVNPEGVDAKLNDGVLTVRIPKAERAQRRRIVVKSACGGREEGPVLPPAPRLSRHV